MQKRVEGANGSEAPPVPKKNRWRTEIGTCKPVEGEEDHEKGLRWSQARNQMGNVNLRL
jgi:hypothetical protein